MSIEPIVTLSLKVTLYGFLALPQVEFPLPFIFLTSAVSIVPSASIIAAVALAELLLSRLRYVISSVPLPSALSLLIYTADSAVDFIKIKVKFLPPAFTVYSTFVLYGTEPDLCESTVTPFIVIGDE